MPRNPVAGPVQIPNAVELAIIWQAAGRTFKNVFHGAFTGTRPINPSLSETIFVALKAATSTTAWLARVHTSCSMTGVTIKDLNSPYQPTNPSTGGSAAGTGTGIALPLNAALVVTLRTNQSGQGYRGRAYLSGMNDAQLADSRTFSAAAGSAAAAFVDGVRNIMDTNTIPMALAQRALTAGTHHDGSPWESRPAALVDVVTINIANPRVDSQRRRLGR